MSYNIEETTPGYSPSRWARFRDWLHGLPDWQFTGVLYLLRWLIIVPMVVPFLVAGPSSSEPLFPGDPWTYLVPFLVVAPVLETLFECTLPYWIMYRLLKLRTDSPWPFVVVSALVMVVVHPIMITTVIFAFVTGAFLAYVYRRFAPEKHWKAMLHTAVFHAGINVVGWTMLMVAHDG